jgi:hypothetical protein
MYIALRLRRGGLIWSSGEPAESLIRQAIYRFGKSQPQYPQPQFKSASGYFCAEVFLISR